ncbi:MAG: DDE-type integrase/transposase/recombinase [bacterium]
MQRKNYTKKQKIIAITMMRRGYTISEISDLRKIPRGTLYGWLDREKKGISQVEKRGRKEKQINPQFISLVIDKWNSHPVGSYKMWILLNKKGFGVSQRQIQKIYNTYKFKMNKRKRPTQIKYVKYERPIPNELWHTDWTTCPYTGKQLIAFIDDYSRFIVHTEYFENATTENTILAFQNAIVKYGKPKEILTDNGSQFTAGKRAIHPEEHMFFKFCKRNEIKHILGRVHHPQTNGKIERWFGTYKTELTEYYKNLDEFVNYYNEVRPHQSLEYDVPASRFLVKS